VRHAFCSHAFFTPRLLEVNWRTPMVAACPSARLCAQSHVQTTFSSLLLLLRDRNATMLHTVLMLGSFAALSTTALAQSCAKPVTPACALERRAPFADQNAFDDCRKEMLAFRDGMTAYAGCLGQASKPAEESAANEEFESVRVQFNRRARGELD
jgi:hypothetical protein